MWCDAWIALVYSSTRPSRLQYTTLTYRFLYLSPLPQNHALPCSTFIILPLSLTIPQLPFPIPQLPFSILFYNYNDLPYRFGDAYCEFPKRLRVVEEVRAMVKSIVANDDSTGTTQNSVPIILPPSLPQLLTHSLTHPPTRSLTLLLFLNSYPTRTTYHIPSLHSS